MTTFGITFLVVLLAATGLRLWLDARHIAYVQAHRGAVPPQFSADGHLSELPSSPVPIPVPLNTNPWGMAIVPRSH